MYWSPLIRGAWIEMTCRACSPRATPSPLIRGAWIEIDRHYRNPALVAVAPHTRGVD